MLQCSGRASRRCCKSKPIHTYQSTYSTRLTIHSFIAGVGLGLPATSFPLAVLCGLGAGGLVGYLIYKGGNKTSLQIFLVISTCFLYLVAAGLFSKGVWNLEQNAWVKLAGEGAAEAGAGPGSYDIRKSVWHVNVSPLLPLALVICR